MLAHQDQVVHKPDCAKIIGTSDFCKLAALKYDERALTLQPHPEFKINFLKDLLELRREHLPKEVADKALETLSREHDAVKVAKYIADFYRQTP